MLGTSQSKSAYMPRVAIVTGNGDAIYHLPGEAARAFVSAGHAVPQPSAGSIRAVVLAQPASTHAIRTGPPSSGFVAGVKFTRWARLLSTRVLEHHPRALLRYA